MPEGDTIYRAAKSLRPALEGRQIVAAKGWKRFVDSTQLRGDTVKTVEARGKHLLFHLQSGNTIHSHMGMTGSWHIYEQNQPWQKPPQQAALTLETDRNYSVVCFTPKLLELLSATDLRRHRWLARLAPDLLDPNFGHVDTDEILRRFHIHRSTPIGEAIMNQSVICGVGNVYKSEVLFLLGLNPFAAVKEFDADTLKSLVTESRRLMRRNLDGRSRQTKFGMNGRPGKKWVYGRSGDGCLKCGATIQMRRQGDLGRSTYYCVECQKVAGLARVRAE